jgi:pimeloyl-ACP methyl ester carboxylesterase
MPVVLVRGNPETEVIWDDLRAQLGREDVMALSPPGFGAPVPPGFEATSDGYLAWLVAQLESLRGPIDLVEHDWSGAHVVRLAYTRTDLVRSWVTEVASAFDHEYCGTTSRGCCRRLAPARRRSRRRWARPRHRAQTARCRSGTRRRGGARRASDC